MRVWLVFLAHNNEEDGIRIISVISVASSLPLAITEAKAHAEHWEVAPLTPFVEDVGDGWEAKGSRGYVYHIESFDVVDK